MWKLNSARVKVFKLEEFIQVTIKLGELRYKRPDGYIVSVFLLKQWTDVVPIMMASYLDTWTKPLVMKLKADELLKDFKLLSFWLEMWVQFEEN